MALPSPPSLTATVQYQKFITSAVLYVPTIASQSAPTLAEFNAGKNLTSEIEAITGFDTQVAELANPKMGTTFVGNLPGRETPNQSSIDFALSTAGPTVDIRSVLTLGLSGFIVMCNEGIVTGGYCDIWPIRVSSVVVPQDIEALAKATVMFSIPKTPSRYIAIPTA